MWSSILFGMKMYDIINYTDCSELQQQEIFNLRNHPEIRKWMTNPEQISWKSHLSFVGKLRQSDDRIYYAVYQNSKLVGTYNLTRESDGVWERGIITSPLFQGSGSTIEMEKYILGNLPSDKFKWITAKVKLDNVRSIRYHKKVGYQEYHRNKEYIYFKLNINMIQKSVLLGGGKNLTSNDCLTQMALIISLVSRKKRYSICK